MKALRMAWAASSPTMTLQIPLYRHSLNRGIVHWPSFHRIDFGARQAHFSKTVPQREGRPTLIAPSTRPFLAITVVWHPSFADGEVIAEQVFRHFGRDALQSVSGGVGVSVPFRYQPPSGGLVPIPVAIDESKTAAILILADTNLIGNPAWVSYVEDIVDACDKSDLRARPFLVSVDAKAVSMSPKVGRINFLRWDNWAGGADHKTSRLISDLTYQCCRMLRAWLSQMAGRRACRDAFADYLSNIQLFLSHSKRDDDEAGETIALAIRDHLHASSGYDSFFDVHDIPPGISWADVIHHNVRRSAFLAIHTDSYSTREWCRREVIEAKRTGVPMVVAHAVTDREERSFPYLGNVPVVRMAHDQEAVLEVARRNQGA
ncbi:MAG: toll/interleukin-1 receptor domain-containing protein [Rhodospirillaceae bacterium]